MSLLDNNILENTDAKNLGFPKYEDFEPKDTPGPYRRFWWITKSFGGPIVKEGISINIHEHCPNHYNYEDKVYQMMVRVGEEKGWCNFLKISQEFDTLEEAKTEGYKLLLYFKDNRWIFEYLCNKYPYDGGRYNIPKRFTLKELYEIKQDI